MKLKPTVIVAIFVMFLMHIVEPVYKYAVSYDAFMSFVLLMASATYVLYIGLVHKEIKKSGGSLKESFTSSWLWYLWAILIFSSVDVIFTYLGKSDLTLKESLVTFTATLLPSILYGLVYLDTKEVSGKKETTSSSSEVKQQ